MLNYLPFLNLNIQNFYLYHSDLCLGKVRFHVLHSDFVQASKLYSFNQYLVGSTSGKNWLFVIGYWSFVIFWDQNMGNVV